MQRRTFLVGLGSLAAISPTVGCGTLLHMERCGQPHSRDLDWKMVALDGLGLLLFFVPGIVAFVVDFYTGAIYLPPECPCSPMPPPAMPAPGYSPYDVSPPAYPVLPAPPQASCNPLQRIDVPHKELSLARIEQVVSRHTGRPIVLTSSETRLSPLANLDGYGEQCRRHRADRKFGFGLKSLLKGFQQV